MNSNLSRCLAFVVFACVSSSFLGVSFAVAQSKQIEETRSPTGEVPTLDLTLAQKKTIYQEVRRGKSIVGGTGTEYVLVRGDGPRSRPLVSPASSRIPS